MIEFEKIGIKRSCNRCIIDNIINLHGFQYGIWESTLMHIIDGWLFLLFFKKGTKLIIRCIILQWNW
jgi:hypothetical protein